MGYNSFVKDVSADEIIIYLRKSRADDPSESVEEVLSKHERILQDFAVKTWGKNIAERSIYREVVSGETIKARPVMQTVMRLIEYSRYKAILIIEPQRLTRGDLEDCGRIINALRYTDTLVITPSITYDLNDKRDRKFFESELVRGNDYLEYIKEIMGRGRVAAVMRGCYLGNVAPYGYSKHVIGKDNTLIENPDEASALLKMYRWYVYDDVGTSTIAKRLDELCIPTRKKGAFWSPAAIEGMLHNPVYDGKIRWGYRACKKIMVDGRLTEIRPKAKAEELILVEGIHDAIIPHDLWLAAQQKKGKTSRKKGCTELRNPLAGLLKCTCGRTMSLRTYTKNGIEKSNPRLLCDNQNNCHTRSVLYQDLIAAIADALEAHIEDFKVQPDKDDPFIYQKKVTDIEDILKKLDKKSQMQKELLEEGIYTKEEYKERNAKLKNKITELEAAAERLKKAAPEAVKYGERSYWFSQVLDMMRREDAAPGELNKLLKSIIERVDYGSTSENARKSGERLHGGWDRNEFCVDIFFRL